MERGEQSRAGNGSEDSWHSLPTFLATECFRSALEEKLCSSRFHLLCIFQFREFALRYIQGHTELNCLLAQQEPCCKEPTARSCLPAKLMFMAVVPSLLLCPAARGTQHCSGCWLHSAVPTSRSTSLLLLQDAPLLPSWNQSDLRRNHTLHTEEKQLPRTQICSHLSVPPFCGKARGEI